MPFSRRDRMREIVIPIRHVEMRLPGLGVRSLHRSGALFGRATAEIGRITFQVWPPILGSALAPRESPMPELSTIALRHWSRQQDCNSSRLLPAPFAAKAGADRFQVAGSAALNNLDCAHGPGRPAMPAHDLQAASKADEISRCIDVLGGHAPSLD